MDITAEAVAAAGSSFSSLRGQGTLSNVLAFARALKELGVKVSLSQVIDASRSLEVVDIAEKADFRALLRSNLISQKEDFLVFDWSSTASGANKVTSEFLWRPSIFRGRRRSLKPKKAAMKKD